MPCQAARSLALVVALAATSLSAAAEGSGCQAFIWSPSAAQELIQRAAGVVLPRGSALALNPSAAFSAALSTSAEAALPHAAERPAPFAAWVTLQVQAAGLYEVALSGEGWIDVIDQDAFLKAAQFTGATDCPGVRKMVRFNLPSRPVVLQISTNQTNELRIAVRPVAQP